MEIDQPAFEEIDGDSDSDSDSDSESVTTSSATSIRDDLTLLTFPRKRARRQDDLFFQEGIYEYKAAWLRLEDENAYIPDILDTENDAPQGTRSRSHLTLDHKA
ncbi:hypothetical protein BGZ65_002997 [Modicella reniformis]|uniref:Uncharacterized protein n=1 Tax=Modicella reniformis TaxID=1440133 RepID=A0A9P6MHS8_9FUNG|nr:hypothetical protein BGZ65_002997 [Modicella reniformis]